MSENNKNIAVKCVGATKRFIQDKHNGIAGWFNPTYKTAVKDVSFEVERGEIFGIIGPNGSGKSTLIRMLATLLIPDSGYLEVFGHDVVKDTYAVRGLMNRVSVDASFFKKLSVAENLSYAARIYGLNVKDALERAVELLSIFGLKPEKMRSPVEDLSRGQQQMVSIARSMLSKPNLMLLDEPTTGLDPMSKKQVQDFVQEIRKQHDATVILTSHDMLEVEKLCGRIAFIRDGMIWACGTADELKSKAGEDTLENVFLSLTGSSFDKDEILVGGK